MPTSTTTRKSSPKTPTSPTPRRPAPKKRKRRSPIGRIALWGLVGVLAAGTGFLLKTAGDLGVNITQLPWIVRNPRGQFPGKDRVNILVVGKDYSYVWTNKNDANSGQPYTKESRADTIVMVSLDLTTKKATALSIPRDSLVKAPDGQTGKINATYRRGGEKLLKETVTELLGVAPDYVVTLKDKAVQNVVDAVGGITVETIDEMHRDDAAANLHIHLPKGEQRLTGEQAIGFVRYREPTIALWKDNKPVFKPGSNNPVLLPKSEIRYSKEDGDFRRMKRQQDLIRAVVDEAKKPGNLVRIGPIADTSLQQLETELTREQILALATLYQGSQTEKIQTRTLLGKDGKLGKSYAFLIDTEKKNYLVDWLLKGDESAAYRLTTIAVKNSTSVSGAARQVASMLRTEGGFEADSAGNAEATVPEASATQIVYSKASFEAHARRVAQLLGGGKLVKEAAPDTTGVLDKDAVRPDITVVLGKDLAESFAQRTAQH
jgi:polyisoprenyl-teichoic acid--peptidoglycan teichoic acid transferase